MIEFLPPEVLDAGKVQLRWRIHGARLAVLEGYGEVPAEDGGQVVEVGRTTTFVLTAYGDELGAVDSRSVTVTVPEPPFEQQVPVGTIALWHGDPAWIPSGWQLCDGRAGTPDVTNRFVLGASEEDAGHGGPGDAHVHMAMVVITGRSEPHGQHTHEGPADWEAEEAATPARWYNRWRGRVTAIDPVTGASLGDGEPHTHDVRVTCPRPTSEARPPEPPWYALCYIKRVAGS
jgi:hypothetical protein